MLNTKNFIWPNLICTSKQKMVMLRRFLSYVSPLSCQMGTCRKRALVTASSWLNVSGIAFMSMRRKSWRRCSLLWGMWIPMRSSNTVLMEGCCASVLRKRFLIPSIGGRSTTSVLMCARMSPRTLMTDRAIHPTELCREI